MCLAWDEVPRSRLPLTVHQEVFTWVLKALSKEGLVLGGRIGVHASTMEAHAALKTIVRRDTGESYRKRLVRMTRESGIESPTDEELARLDRKRKGKTLSNKDWQSPADPGAKITKLKDGRTHLAYKPEHAVDRSGGMRRVWLRGRENIQKRYLLHVAGFNLGLLMRVKTGHGPPRVGLIGTNQPPKGLFGRRDDGRGAMLRNLPIAVLCGGE